MRGQQVAASILAWTFRDLRLPKLYLKKSYLNQCYLKINFVPRIERNFVGINQAVNAVRKKSLLCVGRM